MDCVNCENCENGCCGKIGQNSKYDSILQAFDGCTHTGLIKKADQLVQGDKYDQAAGKLMRKMLFIASLYERFEFMNPE